MSLYGLRNLIDPDGDHDERKGIDDYLRFQLIFSIAVIAFALIGCLCFIAAIIIENN